MAKKSKKSNPTAAAVPGVEETVAPREDTRPPKAPYKTQEEQIAEFKENNPDLRLTSNETSLKIPGNAGTPNAKLSWKDKANAGLGPKIGVTAPYGDLGRGAHAALFDAWQANPEIKPEDVEKIDLNAEPHPHSDWAGTVPTTSRWTKETYQAPIISDIDKLTMQQSGRLSALTAAARKKKKAEAEAFAADPANAEVIKHRESEAASKNNARIRSIGLGGEDTLTSRGKFRPAAKEALANLKAGKVLSGRKIELGNNSRASQFPLDLSDPRQQHAHLSPDTRPDISIRRQSSEPAAEYFGMPGFDHHSALASHVTQLLSKNQNMDGAATRAAIEGARPIMSLGRQVTPLTIPTRQEHHATKALEYLAASAKAHSLGYKDIAVNNYAQAVEHAKHLETANRTANPAATNTLASLLSAGGNSAITSQAGNHLTAYKLHLGVK